MSVCSLCLDSVGSAHFKFSTHPGWLLPLCPAAPSLPDAAGEAVCCGGRRSEEGRTGSELYGGHRPLTFVEMKRGLFAAPLPTSQPVGNKAPSVSRLVAQLDTAVEPSQLETPGLDGALWPDRGVLPQQSVVGENHCLLLTLRLFGSVEKLLRTGCSLYSCLPLKEDRGCWVIPAKSQEPQLHLIYRLIYGQLNLSSVHFQCNPPYLETIH